MLLLVKCQIFWSLWLSLGGQALQYFLHICWTQKTAGPISCFSLSKSPGLICLVCMVKIHHPSLSLPGTRASPRHPRWPPALHCSFFHLLWEGQFYGSAWVSYTISYSVKHQLRVFCRRDSYLQSDFISVRPYIRAFQLRTFKDEEVHSITIRGEWNCRLPSICVSWVSRLTLWDLEQIGLNKWLLEQNSFVCRGLIYCKGDYSK